MVEGLKTVIVTGGSRGIGAGIARMFGERGWNVVLTYAKNADAATQVVSSIKSAGGIAIAMRCDARSEEDIKALFSELDRLEIRPYALINNAGTMGVKTRLEDLSTEVLREVVEVNLIGVILFSREAVRRMAVKRGGEGGVIINISSTGTKLGNPNQWVHYAATKGGIDVLTNGMARELAVDGIRVAAVSPGLTLTDPALETQINERLKALRHEIPMERAGSVEEVAEGVYWLCSDAASYCTGVVLPIAGGR